MQYVYMYLLCDGKLSRPVCIIEMGALHTSHHLIPAVTLGGRYRYNPPYTDKPRLKEVL